MLDDGNQAVGYYRYTDLYSDSILCRAPKLLYLQVLLDLDANLQFQIRFIAKILPKVLYFNYFKELFIHFYGTVMK